MSIEISMIDESISEVFMRPVCSNCGYIFRELTYHIREKIFTPNLCPQCGKPIERIVIPDMAMCSDWTMNFAFEI